MEKQIRQLIEHAKQDRKGLKMLKDIAVRCSQFELAAQLREMETTIFPETDEEKEAKKQAKDIRNVLSMVDLKVSEDVCWLIAQTLKKHSMLKGKFSLKDAAQLMAKRNEIFGDGM